MLPGYSDVGSAEICLQTGGRYEDHMVFYFDSFNQHLLPCEQG